MVCKTCGQILETEGSMVGADVTLMDVHQSDNSDRLVIDSKVYKTDVYLLKCLNCNTLLSSVFTADIKEGGRP